MSFDNSHLENSAKQYEASMGFYWSDIETHMRAARRLRAETMSHGMRTIARAVARPVAAVLHRLANLLETSSGASRPAH